MCTTPIKCFFAYDYDPNEGVYVWSIKEAKCYNHFEEAEVPCGKCLECTKRDMKGWTARALCEHSMHDCSCFVTITYNDEFLPDDAGLCRSEVKAFTDRLRTEIKRKYNGRKIVIFGCGEYGGNPGDPVKTPEGRPHYHLCIFGFDFPDKTIFKMSDSGFPLYRSSFLERIWSRDGAPKGFCTVQNLEFGDMAYCAGYVDKKALKKATAAKRYETPEAAQNYCGSVYFGKYVCSMKDGVFREAEFRIFPTRPALGRNWLDKYFSDAYPSGFIVIDGKKFTVPKYFDKIAKERNPEMFDKVKQERREKALLRVDENTPERRAVREELLRLKIEKTRKKEL